MCRTGSRHRLLLKARDLQPNDILVSGTNPGQVFLDYIERVSQDAEGLVHLQLNNWTAVRICRPDDLVFVSRRRS